MECHNSILENSQFFIYEGYEIICVHVPLSWWSLNPLKFLDYIYCSANEWNAYGAELNLLVPVMHLVLYRWPENIKTFSECSV